MYVDKNQILKEKKQKERGAVLDWAEEAGLENLKFRLQNAETLAKEANTTLTILLAGIGGSLAYAARYSEAATLSVPMAVGAGALSIWLMFLSVLMVHYCVKTLPIQPPTNEPKHLNQPEHELDALRKVELDNIQQRINLVVERNASVAKWLDRIRYGTLVSPLVFTGAALAAWVYWPDLCALVAAAG